jgi:hypothetical protein
MKALPYVVICRASYLMLVCWGVALPRDVVYAMWLMVMSGGALRFTQSTLR